MRSHSHLRTFWCRRISLISPIPRNDSYDDSHYILHGTLILAVRLSEALSFPTLSREFPTQALPPAQVTVGLPQMDRAAGYSNSSCDFVSQHIVMVCDGLDLGQVEGRQPDGGGHEDRF